MCCSGKKSALMDPLLHIPTIKKLVATHASQHGPLNVLSSRSTTATQLEVDEFKLVLRKLEFDVKAFRIYARKMADVKDALFHGQLDFKRRQQQLAVSEMERFLDQYVLLLNAEEITASSGGQVAGEML